jgi:carboxymethylenebutenolidase
MDTNLTSADGHHVEAYEQNPEGATRCVVVVQEIFGVNSHIRSLVDRYAALGYRAIAPALFDRVEAGVELDYENGLEKGLELLSATGDENAVRDIGAAVDHVAPTGPVAVVGYCWGGLLAWLSAAELPIQAAVGYYGGRITTYLDQAPAVPILLHFGDSDASIPLEAVEEIRAAYPDLPVHIYPAGHGFSCDVRGSYHQESADLALERTLAFLDSNL